MRVLFVAFLLCVPATVAAHGGGKNSCGCHVKKSTGSCHCHGGASCGCSCEPYSCKEKPAKSPTKRKQKGEKATVEFVVGGLILGVSAVVTTPVGKRVEPGVISFYLRTTNDLARKLKCGDSKIYFLMKNGGSITAAGKWTSTKVGSNVSSTHTAVLVFSQFVEIIDAIEVNVKLCAHKFKLPVEVRFGFERFATKVSVP